MSVLCPRLARNPIAPDAEFDCAVLGIGRLGLCFALTLERAGLKVIGVDVNEGYVRKIASKELVSDEPGLTEAIKDSINFEATTDLAKAVNGTKLLFILVATPTDGGKYYYDHNVLSGLLVKLNEFELKDTMIVINSTLYPGYIRNIGYALLSKCERTTISYNPAFVAQGDVMSGYRTGGWFGMVLVGAADERVSQILQEIYTRLSAGNDTNICIMSPESAEICKLASNCFRTTKISFANMIGDLADRTPGAEKHEICNALKKDRSIGSICMTPGYGYGGPCYPRDNKALSIYARQVGIRPLLPVATDEYNDLHHSLMVEELSLTDENVFTFENVTYKPNCAVPMIDKSPKLEVACALARAGKRVKIVDRVEVITEVMKEYGNLFTYEIEATECGVRTSFLGNVY